MQTAIQHLNELIRLHEQNHQRRDRLIALLSEEIPGDSTADSLIRTLEVESRVGQSWKKTAMRLKEIVTDRADHRA